MEFKGTYVMAALVVLGGVAAIAVTGGVWGTVAIGWGLTAILTGAVLFTLAWRSSRGAVREETPNIASNAPFAGYPMDRALGIFDLERDATEATADLRAAGYSDVSRFAGNDGAQRLDSQGTEHGVTQRIERSIDHVASDVSDLEQYDEAVRLGSIVIGVHVPSADRRERVADIMRRHRGHDVRYFGQMAVESLNPDPSRVRTD